MKKILSMMAVFALMSTTSFASFTDVTSNTDYDEAIEWMADNGVINGYGDGRFGPDNCVKRVEILKMVFETLDIDETSHGDYFGPFLDTPLDEWYADYLLTARERGTIEGYDDGTFRPAQCVTRAEAVKIAFKEFGFSEVVPDVGIGHADLDMDEWYFPYVFNSIGSNLVGREHEGDSPDGGMASKLFYPADDMSRKEVAEMLYRMKAVVDNDVLEYSDEIPNPINETSNYSSEVEKLSHTNSTLNINFQYPAAWGLITETIESDDHMYLSIPGEEFSLILLGADSNGESLGRGGYFGDAAELIENQEYIDNLCEEKSETSDYCEVKTNANGITYAKVNEEIFDFGGYVEVTQYYIYNPHSTYRGMIISDDRVEEIVTESDYDIVDDLDELVDSLIFLTETP